METFTGQPDPLHKIFLKFGTVYTREGTVYTELDEQHVGPIAINVLGK